ncbi:hypothetical protein PR202_ga21934 [Eleusine coracana subsp. coracana]|uniref:Uncharacterized protein n=1 Tax=Eleusine coracana subsp. coracana TaxID=191504 RepID=A0AAV5D2L0_ELECO|nr:hypothetical protein PR202_ga21934 [Eleusine coracana subsp. coracana]
MVAAASRLEMQSCDTLLCVSRIFRKDPTRQRSGVGPWSVGFRSLAVCASNPARRQHMGGEPAMGTVSGDPRAAIQRRPSVETKRIRLRLRIGQTARGPSYPQPAFITLACQRWPCEAATCRVSRVAALHCTATACHGGMDAFLQAYLNVK